MWKYKFGFVLSDQTSTVAVSTVLCVKKHLALKEKQFFKRTTFSSTPAYL